MLLQLRFVSACRKIACIALLATATVASGQTISTFRYVIPQFNGTSGSELILNNLSNDSVQAEVRFLSVNGAVLTNATVTVAAGSQTRLNSTFFTATEGSAVVQSSGPLSVMGTLAQSNSAFENEAPAPLVTDSIIPFSLGNASKMDLTFVNGNSLPTTALIRTFAPDGTPTASVQRTLPPLGSLTEAVSALFPQLTAASAREIAYLGIKAETNVISEERRLSVHARVRDYSDPSVLTAVTAGAALLNSALPFFTTGGDFVTTIQVINPSNSLATVSILAFGDDGRLLSAGKAFQLAGINSIRNSAQTLLTLGSNPTSGSIVIKSDVPILATEAITNTRTSAFVLTPAVSADTSFVFSQRRSSSSLVGLTLLNQNGSPAHVRLRSILDNGTPVDQISVTVSPFGSITRLFSEYISDNQVDGFIYVSSDVPIFASAVENNTSNTLLANLPPMHSQPGYLPPNPTQFRIKGSLRRTGNPVAGLLIQMTGPVTASSLTDSTGTYLQRVPPGEYSVEPMDDRYVFNPPSRAVTILLDDSVDNNFEASLIGPTPTPTLLSISPSTVVARLGSSAAPLPLAVVGLNFVPGAKVFLDGVEIETQFLNTTALAATIPATAVETGGSRLGAVRNPAPTLGLSNALPLLITTPGPILTSIDPPTVTFVPGVPTTITLVGENFASNSIYELTPPCASVFVTNRINFESATISINLQCAGTYYARVRTPQPGGGTSQTLSYSVK